MKFRVFLSLVPASLAGMMGGGSLWVSLGVGLASDEAADVGR